MKTVLRRLCVAWAAVMIAGAVHAQMTIMVEPDDQIGSLTNVGFGVRSYQIPFAIPGL